MNKEESDFYIKIRKDIKNWLAKYPEHKWADYILLTPDLFYLMVKLVLDKNVPVSKKAKLTAAIAYFISPVDFLPELFLGPIGFLDDIAIAAFVLNDLLNEIDPALVKEYWKGEQDLLYAVKNIIANANNMLGAKVIKKIKEKLS